MGVGEFDPFLAGYGWVWVGVSKCGWMWMSTRFITAQICMLYNFDTHHHLFLGSMNNP